MNQKQAKTERVSFSFSFSFLCYNFSFLFLSFLLIRANVLSIACIKTFVMTSTSIFINGVKSESLSMTQKQSEVGKTEAAIFYLFTAPFISFLVVISFFIFYFCDMFSFLISFQSNIPIGANLSFYIFFFSFLLFFFSFRLGRTRYWGCTFSLSLCLFFLLLLLFVVLLLFWLELLLLLPHYENGVGSELDFGL